MSLKTRADIALEKQKLREAERQIIAKENLALGSEIAKGIKEGYFDGETIYKTLALKTKSKKHRVLLALDTIPLDDTSIPPPLSDTKDRVPRNALDRFKRGSL